MSRNSRKKALAMVLAVPTTVYAQALNATIVWVFVGAPLVAILTTVIAGILARRWMPALLGLGLLLFWMAWYWIAAQTATGDLWFWIPIAAVHAQILASVALAAHAVVKRRGDG